MNQKATAPDLTNLLANLDSFIQKTYYIEEKFELKPKREHLASCINYADLQELRTEFLDELINSVTDYVYSRSRQNTMLQRFEEGRTTAAANRKLFSEAKAKFDLDDLQGDFSELLLFNLLQYHFHAVPVVRKSSITTSSRVNRFGADAIHVTQDNDKYVLYIGEAKTYGGLKEGIKKASDDIIFKHYKNHRNELGLYLYEGYVTSELENVIEDYKEGNLTNIEVHFVCLISFDINKVSGNSRQGILDVIVQAAQEETKNLEDSIVYERIPDELIPRINYIIFPVQEMESLLNSFKELF